MIPTILAVMIDSIAGQYGVPVWICHSVIECESGWDAQAVSYNPNSDSWDQGLWQINSKAHPGVDPFDVRSATKYAVKYLRYLYDRTGSWHLALTAYNGGIGRIARPPKQSVRYARLVLSMNPRYI